MVANETKNRRVRVPFPIDNCRPVVVSSFGFARLKRKRETPSPTRWKLARRIISKKKKTSGGRGEERAGGGGGGGRAGARGGGGGGGGLRQSYLRNWFQTSNHRAVAENRYYSARTPTSIQRRIDGISCRRKTQTTKQEKERRDGNLYTKTN